MTHGRRNLVRSQRCWCVSTIGSMAGFSSAWASAAPAANEAARNSRRFINDPPRGQRALVESGYQRTCPTRQCDALRRHKILRENMVGFPGRHLTLLTDTAEELVGDLAKVCLMPNSQSLRDFDPIRPGLDGQRKIRSIAVPRRNSVLKPGQHPIVDR